MKKSRKTKIVVQGQSMGAATALILSGSPEAFYRTIEAFFKTKTAMSGYGIAG